MQIKQGMQEVWAQGVEDNSHDDYSKATVDYAERWANLMEIKLAEGNKLEDIADAASHEADTDGISGFMYGAAVHILSQVWIHGAALRTWHNKEWGGTGDEDGTINPAILTLP